MKANWRCLLVGLALTVNAAETQRGVTVVPVAATAPGGNAGLFAGVNQFTEDKLLRPLQFAVNDAIAQAHLFVLDLKLVTPTNTYLALSGEPTSDSAKAQLAALQATGVQRIAATKTVLLRNLQAVAALATKGDDLLIVSLSSHGFQEGGQAYVLPSNGLHSDLQQTGINVGSIEERLAKSKAGKRLLLVDACRENPTVESRGTVDVQASVAFRAALAAAEGQAVLASCDAGQVSLENPELNHGVFTFFLLDALKGKAPADAHGFITLGAVKNYVAQAVQDWVVRSRPGVERAVAQHPWFKGPAVAEQIPLAVDPGVRVRLGAFKEDVTATDKALRGKISHKGEFTATMYARLADALEQAQDDDAGRKLLERSKAFIAGKLPEDVFVAYLDKTLGKPAQQPMVEPKPVTEPKPTPEPKPAVEPKPAPEPKPAIEPKPTTEPKPIITHPSTTGAKRGAIKTIDLGGAKLELVWISPGEFMMGSTRGGDSEKPAHRVRITKGFWLGRCEVTQQQYEAVMGANPSRFKGAQNPVEQVSWEDAVAFCRKIRARLPTEAEWEYACRAGTSTKFSNGDTDRDGSQAAWHFHNSANAPHPVGQKTPNAWGLSDMHGNAWEWCADWHGEYLSGDATNPTGPASGQSRILRGGSWFDGLDYCSTAFRFWRSPEMRDSNFGFRVAIDAP